MFTTGAGEADGVGNKMDNLTQHDGDQGHVLLLLRASRPPGGPVVFKIDGCAQKKSPLIYIAKVCIKQWQSAPFWCEKNKNLSKLANLCKSVMEQGSPENLK